MHARLLPIATLVVVAATLQIACNASDVLVAAFPPPTPTSPPKPLPVMLAPTTVKPKSSPFLDSDCACLGRPLSSSESQGDRLICAYEWKVTVGDSYDTNQVQLHIDPWQGEQNALNQLASAAQSLASEAGTVSMEGDQDLYYIEEQGNAGFFYGELRAVFAQGFYLSTDVRGYYSGAGEVSSILHTAKQCNP